MKLKTLEYLESDYKVNRLEIAALEPEQDKVNKEMRKILKKTNYLKDNTNLKR